MLFNELAQWAVLVFVTIFVLGLTRQLANFLVPPRDRAALEAGPPLGKELPSGVLHEDERRLVRELMASRRRDWVMFLIVGEECIACDGVLERLNKSGRPRGLPLVALSRQSSDEHRRRLEKVADLVIVDNERLEKAGLAVTPFAVIVNKNFRVVHKQLAWDLAEVVDVWQGEFDRAPTESENGDPRQDPLNLIQVGEDR